MSNPIREKMLLWRIRAKGDQDAYASLYDEYVTPIYRFISFKVRGKEEAEDLTSEVFLRSWEYLRGRGEVRSLRAFLYQVARNLVIDYWRHKTHELRLEERLETIPDLRQMSMQHEVEVRSDMVGILGVVRELKEEYREILLLRYLDELKTSEIGIIVGKNQGATRVLLHRAVKAARQLYERKSEKK